METFLVKLADILEVDKVNMNDVFVDYEEWDSLTSLSIIATIDTHFNVNITAEELLSASTVEGLVQLIENKVKKQ